MTNKEWLKMVKESDEENLKTAENDMVLFVDEMNTTNELNYRQVKAMEIIAEELIELNKNMDRDYVLKRGTIDQDGHLVNERE